MGLLDSVVNSVLGGQPGQPGQPGQAPGGSAGGLGELGALAGVLGPLLISSNGPVGGLGGLVGKFSQAGLGHLVQSWIGTGANLPVSETQVGSALGSDTIGQLAAKAGLNPAQLQALLAQYLPLIVDKLTPHGTLPAPGTEPAGAGGLLGALEGMLQKR